MNGEGEINVDYIMWLNKKGDEYVIEKYKIQHPNEILEQLDVFEQNPLSYDFFYIQKCVKNYNISRNHNYSYCWPYPYSDAYVWDVKFPKYISQVELANQMLSIMNQTIEECKANNKSSEYANEKVREKQEQYLKDCVIAYIRQLRRYIYAQCYWEQLPKIKTLALVYSSEEIGWYKPEYAIAEDVSFSAKTNFCFGRAAYFYINIIYKGINVLPYDNLVKYHWSNMMEHVRYTADFYPKRENWKHALSFAKEISDMITTDRAKFEKIWIIDKVEYMMKGLKIINDFVDKYFEEQVEHHKEETQNKISFEDKVSRYNYIDNYSIKRYKVYPKEMQLAIQAEKLSAALDLLGDLTSIKTIYNPILKHIETIVQYNKKLVSPLNDCCENIESKLLELKKQEDKLNEKKKRIENKIERKKCEIEKKIKETNKEYNKNMYSKEKYDSIVKRACEEDECYNKLSLELLSIQLDHMSLTTEINSREDFMNLLKERKEFIVQTLEEYASLNDHS